MTWSAKQYLAFDDERTRPVRDLADGSVLLPFPRLFVIAVRRGEATVIRSGHDAKRPMTRCA